jgi:hypothetical protein
VRAPDSRSPDRKLAKPQGDARLDRFLLIANVLDQLFRVPGTKLRFGLDGILGLVPFAGDLVTGLLGAYGLVVAQQLGAPGSIQIRMLLNLLVDTGIGAIPLLGDLFDFAFKAHTRNARLLQGWLSQPHAARRSSIFVLAGVLAIFVASIAAVGWLAFAAVRGLIHLFAGAG